jgi:membrane protein YqaA with SNARE-associated domain
MFAILFVYAFVSNVALALLPHEPVVVWYGARLGVWLTALVATAGTLAAAWVDHTIFVPLITRATAVRPGQPGPVGRLLDLFARAPFAILALSGVTPLPFFPFKALAFASRYPLDRYLAAVALGRFPRYVLLAWLGVALPIPTWLLAAAFPALAIPPLRMLRWQRRGAS